MNDCDNPQPQQHDIPERQCSGYFAGLFGAILGLSLLVCGFVEMVRLINWVSRV